MWSMFYIWSMQSLKLMVIQVFLFQKSSNLASEMKPPFMSCCTALCVETFAKWLEASKP